MSDALSVEIGKIIRRERQTRGVTIESLANETGRSRVTVINAEAGRRLMKVNVLFDFLWALDCSQDVFLEILSLDASLRGNTPAGKGVA